MPLHLLRCEREDKTGVKRSMACEDRGRIGFAFVFACMVGKNQKTPKLSPMADDAITQKGKGGLGSLVYVCGGNAKYLSYCITCVEKLLTMKKLNLLLLTTDIE